MADTFDFRLGTLVPGASWAGQWRDTFGKPVISDKGGHPVKGSVLIDSEIHLIQSDPFHAPSRHSKLKVDIAGYGLYEVLVPTSEINGTRAAFKAAMEARVLPEGITCTESLRDAMLAASFAPETWIQHDRESVSTVNGIEANGKLLSTIRFTIAGESVNEYGEKAYVLRTEDGKRITVDATEMPLGKYAYKLGVGAAIFDSIELWFHLSREWAARSDAEKREFDLEPIRKEHAEAAEKLRAKEQDARWGSSVRWSQ
jgi:hypothetical protein